MKDETDYQLSTSVNEGIIEIVMTDEVTASTVENSRMKCSVSEGQTMPKLCWLMSVT
jgi:hypothetical protein